jgi:hypothetical protein
MNVLSRRGVVTGLGIAVSGGAFVSDASEFKAPTKRSRLTPDRTINQFLMAGDLGHAELQHQTLADPNVELLVSRPDQTVRYSGAEAIVAAWTRARVGRNFAHMVSTAVTLPLEDAVSLRCYAVEHCYGASGVHRLGESHYLFDCLLDYAADGGLVLRRVVSRQLCVSGVGMDWFGSESSTV